MLNRETDCLSGLSMEPAMDVKGADSGEEFITCRITWPIAWALLNHCLAVGSNEMGNRA